MRIKNYSKGILPISFNNEDEVKAFYIRIFEDILNCRFKSIEKTDGLFENDKTKLLVEYKSGGNLHDQLFLSRCICQVLCYIKNIEKKSIRLPNLIFIANKFNWCIFNSSILSDYLNLDYNWGEVNASTVYANPPSILMDFLMSKPLQILIHPFGSENKLISLINNSTSSIGLKSKVNTDNLPYAYEGFINAKILVEIVNPNDSEKVKYEKGRKSVLVFASMIFNECENIGGETSNRINIKIDEESSITVKINRTNYENFKNSLVSIIKPSSKNEIIAQSDRLISEIFRRYYGEFYTPKHRVDKIHYIISDHFGEDWREKYIVWDSACGIGNLTNEYGFKTLYSSTLTQSDIDIMNQRGFNPSSIKFQYDFLDEDIYPSNIIGIDGDRIEREFPNIAESLKNNSPIIFFINPPYTSPGNNKRDGKNKAGAGKNKINRMMLDDKMGYCSCQQHIQFLYKIIYIKEKYKLTNVHIAVLINPLFLSGVSYKNFRKKFFDNFEYKYGMLFNAGEFANVNSDWGILFGIFSAGNELNRTNFEVLVEDDKTMYIKNIYNVDNTLSLTEWVKEPFQSIKKNKRVVSLTTAIEAKHWVTSDFLVRQGFVGWLGNSGNNCHDIPRYTSIYSAGQSLGMSIVPDNFYRAIALFTAKNLYKFNWVSCKDEFSSPNIDHIEYDQWNKDCIIISLFSSGSYQSSLRKLFYQGKDWNIVNEFFWMSNEEIINESDQSGFISMYNDAVHYSKNRFVYNELQTITLSSDAKIVLDKASNIISTSMLERKKIHSNNPNIHLFAWDAGWYQIRRMVDLSYELELKNQLKEFNDLYKKFEDRMREGVYKFGFLK